MFAVQTVDMRVDYGDFVAVNELCLNVPRGEIYGLIDQTVQVKQVVSKYLQL